MATARNGWGEWQTNQGGTIYLVRLGDLQKQLFRRLLEIGPVEDNHAVGPTSWLKPGYSQPVVADFQLIRDDALAFFLFLLL